jgi:hypothetical protein
MCPPCTLTHVHIGNDIANVQPLQTALALRKPLSFRALGALPLAVLLHPSILVMTVLVPLYIYHTCHGFQFTSFDHTS